MSHVPSWPQNHDVDEDDLEFVTFRVYLPVVMRLQLCATHPVSIVFYFVTGDGRLHLGHAGKVA